MKKGFVLLVLALGLLAGCGDAPQGGDLEKTAAQPDANLEAGAKATSMEEWAKANPNNGAPGQGEGGAGK